MIISKWKNFYENLEEHPFLKMIIHMWYERAQMSTDPFDKFIYVWISFEAFASNYTEEDSPFDVRNSLKNDPNIVILYKILMKTKPFSEKIMNLKKECPIYDTRKQHYDDPKFSKTICDPNNFGEVLEVLYKIRNNLFHGGKRPDKERDRKLATLSFFVLYDLLDTIFTYIDQKKFLECNRK
jgi:hypothetical protein